MNDIEVFKQKQKRISELSKTFDLQEDYDDYAWDTLHTLVDKEIALKNIREYCKNTILKDYTNDNNIDCCDKEKAFMANELLEIINGGETMEIENKILVENIKLLQKYLDKEMTEEKFNREFYPYTLDNILLMLNYKENLVSSEGE